MIFEKQPYQQECVNNIITLLKNFCFEKQHSIENLQECLKDFYANHKIPLQTISDSLNLDILMETGTGKTFTYLNTIFELHKTYKQNKFIIFVPRKAILESVKQNINLTKQYFYTQYKTHIKAYFYADSKSQTNIINHYVKNTDELSVLVLTNSAIDKKDNILHRYSEGLFNSQGDARSVFEEIVALKPICFIDEPHLLKGEKFYEVFKTIKTLYFRFGATFPKEDSHKLSNLVYSLDSITAFNNYLVKQIRVHSILDSQENPPPELLATQPKYKKATFVYYRGNIEYKKDVFSELDEDLGNVLEYPPFHNVKIIKLTKDEAILSNKTTLQCVKKDSYTLDEAQISSLISKSIDLHFEKEQRLFAKGIKALSLYFIPNISDFRGENPYIKKEFERLYKEKRQEILKSNISKEYKAYLENDIDSNGELKVCEGYFSGDKGSQEEKEAQGIKLILEQKEKLLSFDTPLRFIFSVWALQEGWDNPNIFTLTKLASSSSDTSRHQQIGRGLRLCVNKEGKRVTHNHCNDDEDIFFAINSLDVLVNGKEKQFIEGLQQEINDSSFSFNGENLDEVLLDNLGLNTREKMRFLSYLENCNALRFDETRNTYEVLMPLCEVIDTQEIKDMLGDKFESILAYFSQTQNKHKQIINANKKPQMINIKPNLAKDFKDLWDTLNQNAKFSFTQIDIESLQKEIIDNFNTQINQLFKPNTIQTKKLVKDNKIVFEKDEDLPQAKDSNKTPNNKHIIQNLLEFAKDFTQDKDNPSPLPLSFVLNIYNKLDKSPFNNSEVAFGLLKNIIKESLHKNIISSVNYEFLESKISNESHLYDSDGKPKKEILYSILGKFIDLDSTPKDNFLFDKVVYDSNIEKDAITQDPTIIKNTTIKVFAKLPKFSITTPFKRYEPDFAYLLQDSNKKQIFFICETKGYDSTNDISDKEQIKIEYAKKFFESLQKHIGDKAEIIFKTRLNTHNLCRLLKKYETES